MPSLNIHLHEFNSNMACGPDKEYNTDVLHKSTLASKVKQSDYGKAIMKSRSAKCPESRPLEGAPIQYNTDAGTALSIEKSVKTTGLKYSTLRSIAPRIGEMQRTEAFGVLDAQYDTQVSDISRSVLKSPVTYSRIRSNESRIAPLPVCESPDVEYNTNIGHRASIEKAVMQSGRNYANMRKQKTRVYLRSELLHGKRPTKKEDNNSPSYNTDTGHKQTLFRSVQNSPIKYATLRGNADSPNRASERFKAAADAKGGDYEVDQGSVATLTSMVKKSSVNYSAMRSEVPRFPYNPSKAAELAEERRQQGLAKLVEKKSKESITKERQQRRTALLHKSKSSAAILETSSYKKTIKPRFKEPPKPMYDSSLGPGSFRDDQLSIGTRIKEEMERHKAWQQRRINSETQNYMRKSYKENPTGDDLPHSDTVDTKQDIKAGSTFESLDDNRCHSSPGFRFAKSKRFDDKIESSKLLGTTFASLTLDKANWNSKGFHFDQKLPQRQVVKKSQVGGSESKSGFQNSLTASVDKSSRLYKASFASNQPRLAEIRNRALSDELGPGKYELKASDVDARASTAFTSLGRQRVKFSTPKPRTAAKLNHASRKL